ncbi:ABC transporter ATP-binding protein [Sporanaerobacter sp. PP17-6a]|jgi:multiple sugar transport system ATP-binding protein|uniref:ABC transporter ATP-binding protein n=1 Tax=Sporanaerobacter sp. PP17-6a TaxID=1891289 RepID=UPI0008A00E16|nr:sn-glycerol-3-phosphate ABC transporter ATP-binding protein UgpC [Sporanaerobacter sp. PP17-6a]SCL96179.1 sn-glycerol-3-phosphate import ATP-binding protein UgpC [Sporanaerobacter sp. PP17-6a]
MGRLSFRNIKKTYKGNIQAVKDFNLEVEDKEFIVLVGPSGCGKSTILRMVAGLEEITGGELYIDDVLMNEISPKDRDIAMVFQNYALYPHMTVYENMSLGLELRKVPKDEIARKIEEVAKTLDIKDLLNRKPKALSGGQQQRVALGRAIVRNPKVFLMDEPLSNLDAKLRVQTRIEVIKLHNELETTFIYVTHDQIEAMTMGTRIIVMKDGCIQQIATPKELYYNPSNIFVAGFIGSPQMNFIDVNVEKIEDIVHLKTKEIEIELNKKKSKKIEEGGYIANKIVIGIRPESLNLIEDSSITANYIEGKVDVIEMVGAESFIHLIAGDEKIVAKINSKEEHRKGDILKLSFDCEDIYLFDKESENAIE